MAAVQGPSLARRRCWFLWPGDSSGIASAHQVPAPLSSVLIYLSTSFSLCKLLESRTKHAPPSSRPASKRAPGASDLPAQSAAPRLHDVRPMVRRLRVRGTSKLLHRPPLPHLVSNPAFLLLQFHCSSCCSSSSWGESGIWLVVLLLSCFST